MCKALIGFALFVVVADGLHMESPLRPGVDRVAVLMAGTAERVLIKPLVANLIRPNSHEGIKVDYYFSLRAPQTLDENEYAADRNESKWLKKEATDRYTMDPKVYYTFQSPVARTSLATSTKELMKSICDFAGSQNAAHCEWEIESEDPLELPDDEIHRSVMTYYNPLETGAGKAVLAKWRSLAGLWKKAADTEKDQGRYNSVVVVRDDDYWIAPYHVKTAEFKEDPSLIKAIPCLESHGINDKAVVMGREAADVLLSSYQTWTDGIDEVLSGSRNAEEFWFKKAILNGLNIQPEGIPMAVASYTTSGIPCFRKQTFNISAAGGYEQCYGENLTNRPLTKFFHAFNCEDLDPQYFDLIPKSSVRALQDGMRRLVEGETQKAIVLTVIDSSQVDLTHNMLSSLAAAGEESSCLVVGIDPNTCSDLSILQFGKNVPRHLCVEVPQVSNDGNASHRFTYIQKTMFKHAVLTTVAVSGLAMGVLYTEPDVVFMKPPVSYFQTAHSNKHIVFAMNNALRRDAKHCEDVADKYAASDSEGKTADTRLTISPEGGMRFDINNGLIYLQDVPGVADVLLRGWMNLVEKGDVKHASRWALTKAIQEASWVEVGHAACDKFVNGNAFWGHRDILRLPDIVAVHANWMDDDTKRVCMKTSGLWNVAVDHAGEMPWWDPAARRLENTEMGGDMDVQVKTCSVDLEQKAAEDEIETVIESSSTEQKPGNKRWLQKVQEEYDDLKQAKQEEEALEKAREERMEAGLETASTEEQKDKIRQRIMTAQKNFAERQEKLAAEWKTKQASLRKELELGEVSAPRLRSHK